MRITEFHITPIALGDPPLLNAAGLHAPYCLRTVVELVTDGGLRGLTGAPGPTVELDRAALARAHATYQRCGLTERNDEIEMRKKIPGWRFAATRW